MRLGSETPVWWVQYHDGSKYHMLSFGLGREFSALVELVQTRQIVLKQEPPSGTGLLQRAMYFRCVGGNHMGSFLNQYLPKPDAPWIGIM